MLAVHLRVARALLLVAAATSACGQAPRGAGERLRIVLSYPGADAEVVERDLVEVVERAVVGVPHLARMVSTASAGRGVIELELAPGSDRDEAAAAVSTLIGDARAMLPEAAGAPTIERVVAQGWVHAQLPARASEAARAALQVIAGVASVEVCAGPRPKLVIELDALRTAARGLDLSAVRLALTTARLDLPAGRSLDPTTTIRTTGAGAASVADLPDQALLPGGVRLGEVADLRLAQSDPCLLVPSGDHALVRIGLRGSRDQRTQVRRAIAERVRALGGETIDPGVTVGVAELTADTARADYAEAWSRHLDHGFAVALARPGAVMLIAGRRDPRASSTARELQAQSAPQDQEPTRWAVTAAPLYQATLVGDDRAALLVSARAAVAALHGDRRVVAAGCSPCAAARRLDVDVDRDRAAALGISAAEVAQAMRASAPTSLGTMTVGDDELEVELQVGSASDPPPSQPLLLRNRVLPLGDVATVTARDDVTEHLRINRARAVQVWAQGPAGASPSSVKAALAAAAPGAALSPVDLDALIDQPWATR